MRILKFRAWIRCGEWDEVADKQRFVMIDSDSLAFEKFAPLCDLLKDMDDEAYYMQYTGLKDKNGKEIYEGDIIESVFSEEKVAVKWNERFAQFTFGGAEFNVEAKPSQIEVVGNIYENTELINQ